MNVALIEDRGLSGGVGKGHEVNVDVDFIEQLPAKTLLGAVSAAQTAERLESSEIEWYLARDFIDDYLRKAFENTLDARRARVGRDDEDDEDFDDEPY